MIILGTNSIKDTGFDVANSLRFNDGSSDYLNRTQSTSPTNSKKGTISFWVKRGALGDQHILNGYTDTNNRAFLNFTSDDRLQVGQKNSGTTVYQIQETAQRRDVSAWYNCIFAFDTTDATASNRLKLYVNGSQVTDFTTNNEIEVNEDIKLFNLANLQLGRAGGGSNYFDGYLAEFVYVDGSQLGADSFGEFDSDSGIWKPIDVSGLTFGNSGFYLDFEDSSALGNDKAGSNNFTVNNLTAIDQSTDTCTNNFATWNPLVGSNAGGSTYYSPTLANGNLKATPGNNAQNPIAVSTIGVSSGKWYAEFVLVSETDSGNASMIGVTDNLSAFQTENTQSSSQIIYGDNGTVYNSRAGDPTDTGTTFSTGNIIGVALDLDNNYIYFSVNGTFISSGNPTSGASGTGGFALGSGTNEYFFMVGDSRDGNTSVFQGNFGGTQTFAISSGNTDGNGYGNFEYSVPANYYSLCSKNLAEYG